MVNSYDDIMGEPMDVDTHPARTKPQATQHYAGDVLPIPGELSMGSGKTGASIDYALGAKTDPQIVPIPRDTLNTWHERMSKVYKGK